MDGDGWWWIVMDRREVNSVNRLPSTSPCEQVRTELSFCTQNELVDLHKCQSLRERVMENRLNFTEKNNRGNSIRNLTCFMQFTVPS
jgi:hypothetical protein